MANLANQIVSLIVLAALIYGLYYIAPAETLAVGQSALNLAQVALAKIPSMVTGMF